MLSSVATRTALRASTSASASFSKLTRTISTLPITTKISSSLSLTKQNVSPTPTIAKISSTSSLSTGFRNMATTTSSKDEDILPVAKSGNDDEVPSIFDQATGLERAEIEYPDLFKHNEVLRGSFGTEENPVKIPSFYDNRIVGCTGRASPNDHDIVWLQIEKGEKTCCSECGQYFVLDPL